MTAPDLTLHDELTRRGLTHEASDAHGKRIIRNRAGDIAGPFSAAEAWLWLRQMDEAAP